MTNNGTIVSVIAGAIAGIMFKNMLINPQLMPLAIAFVGIMGVLIGFYIDYTANYQQRNDEPVLVRSFVFNVIGLICGCVLAVVLIVLGGI